MANVKIKPDAKDAENNGEGGIKEYKDSTGQDAVAFNSGDRNAIMENYEKQTDTIPEKVKETQDAEKSNLDVEKDDKDKIIEENKDGSEKESLTGSEQEDVKDGEKEGDKVAPAGDLTISLEDHKIALDRIKELEVKQKVFEGLPLKDKGVGENREGSKPSSNSFLEELSEEDLDSPLGKVVQSLAKKLEHQEETNVSTQQTEGLKKLEDAKVSVDTAMKTEGMPGFKEAFPLVLQEINSLYEQSKELGEKFDNEDGFKKIYREKVFPMLSKAFIPSSADELETEDAEKDKAAANAALIGQANSAEKDQLEEAEKKKKEKNQPLSPTEARIQFVADLRKAKVN